MSPEQKIAVDAFFAAAEKLRVMGVIRSDRFLGDIAEFLVASKLGMDLAESKRQEGFDGIVDLKKIEVKYNGGSSKTVLCGDPNLYDELVVVLGPGSVLRDPLLAEPYLFYRIPSAEVKVKVPHRDGKLRLGKSDLGRENLLLD